jgi:phage terminase large subunit-like protein
MRDQAAQAKKIPSQESSFRNLQLNQRVDAVTPFISKGIWDKNVAKDLTIDFSELDAFIGIDLSSTTDLTAISIVWPYEVDNKKKYRTETFCFKPEATLEAHENRDRVPYRLWQKQGFLRTTPGKSIDYRFIALELQILAERYSIKSGYFDRWKFQELERELKDIELSLPLAPLGQGFQSISPAVDFFETVLLNEQLEHLNNPLLTWSASNVVLISDPAGNRKADKSRSRSRIDPIVALIMALRSCQVYQLEHQEETVSLYGDDEFFKSIGGVIE